jgi:hypothetical protein
VLQAQDKAYFFIERDPDSDAPRYRYGSALARPHSEFTQLFNHTIDNHWFRFEPKVVFSSTDSLKDAFKQADELVSQQIEDGWLKHMQVPFLSPTPWSLIRFPSTSLRRDAEWRFKPCSIRQLNMLLRMQWAYALKSGANLPEDKLDFINGALSMTNGEVGIELF